MIKNYILSFLMMILIFTISGCGDDKVNFDNLKYFNGNSNYPILYTKNNEGNFAELSSIKKVTEDEGYYKLQENKGKSDDISDSAEIHIISYSTKNNEISDDGAMYFFKKFNNKIYYCVKGDGGQWIPEWRSIDKNYEDRNSITKEELNIYYQYAIHILGEDIQNHNFDDVVNEEYFAKIDKKISDKVIAMKENAKRYKEEQEQIKSKEEQSEMLNGIGITPDEFAERFNSIFLREYPSIYANSKISNRVISSIEGQYINNNNNFGIGYTKNSSESQNIGALIITSTTMNKDFIGAILTSIYAIYGNVDEKTIINLMKNGGVIRDNGFVYTYIKTNSGLSFLIQTEWSYKHNR